MFFVKIKILGKVQGVFLRHNTCQKAVELNILGYVSNLDDGSVFMEAQGEEVKIKELIAWIKTSPGQSEVKKVKVKWGKLEMDNFNGFSIKY